MIKLTVLFFISFLYFMGDRLNAEDRDVFLCDNIKPHGQIKKLNSLESDLFVVGDLHGSYLAFETSLLESKIVKQSSENHFICIDKQTAKKREIIGLNIECNHEIEYQIPKLTIDFKSEGNILFLGDIADRDLMAPEIFYQLQNLFDQQNAVGWKKVFFIMGNHDVNLIVNHFPMHLGTYEVLTKEAKQRGDEQSVVLKEMQEGFIQNVENGNIDFVLQMGMNIFSHSYLTDEFIRLVEDQDLKLCTLDSINNKENLAQVMNRCLKSYFSNYVHLSKKIKENPLYSLTKKDQAIIQMYQNGLSPLWSRYKNYFGDSAQSMLLEASKEQNDQRFEGVINIIGHTNSNGYEAPLDKTPHSIYFDTAVSSVYDYAKKDNGNRDKFFLDGQRDNQVIVFHQIKKDGTIIPFCWKRKPIY